MLLLFLRAGKKKELLTENYASSENILDEKQCSQMKKNQEKLSPAHHP